MPLLKDPRLRIASHRFKGVDEASSDSSSHTVFLLSKNDPNDILDQRCIGGAQLRYKVLDTSQLVLIGMGRWRGAMRHIAK